MRTVIGIDIGGSTTKIVGIRTNEKGIETLIEPIFVTATDALTSVYGAFGKFTMQNGIELSQIDRVLMTGVGSSFIDRPIYGLECTKVSEFVSVGLGGLYQSGLDEAILVISLKPPAASICMRWFSPSSLFTLLTRQEAII